jgi:hypothetical protein
MRKPLTWVVATVATFAAFSTSALAQGVSFQRVILDACYDPAFRVSQRERGIVLPYLNKAIDAYAATVRSGANIDDLYWGKRNKRHWSLDGVEADTRVASDPWAASTARVELVEFVRANAGGLMTARWNALDSDGHILGTYDALLTPRARRFALMELQLHSRAHVAELQPLKTFCLVPGDIEKRLAEKAAHDAARADRAPSR